MESYRKDDVIPGIIDYLGNTTGTAGLPTIPVTFGVLVLASLACWCLFRTEALPLSIPLKHDVMVSILDLLSDLLYASTAQFASTLLFIAAWCFAGTVASLVAVLWEYGHSIHRLAVLVATSPYQRLNDNGWHQVYEKAGANFEHALANFFATIGIVILLCLAPIVYPLTILLFLVCGVLLHSCRLLVSPAVCRWYTSAFRESEDFSDSDEEADGSRTLHRVPALEDQRVDLELWRKTVLLELAMETVPFLAVNVVNQMAFHTLTWQSGFQALFSCYMILRSAYRYAWAPYWNSTSWTKLAGEELDEGDMIEETELASRGEVEEEAAVFAVGAVVDAL